MSASRLLMVVAITHQICPREPPRPHADPGLVIKFPSSFLTPGCRSFGKRFAMVGLASGGNHSAIHVVQHVGVVSHSPLRTPSGPA